MIQQLMSSTKNIVSNHFIWYRTREKTVIVMILLILELRLVTLTSYAAICSKVWLDKIFQDFWKEQDFSKSSLYEMSIIRVQTLIQILKHHLFQTMN